MDFNFLKKPVPKPKVTKTNSSKIISNVTMKSFQ